jgi:hypothetical protein
MGRGCRVRRASAFAGLEGAVCVAARVAAADGADRRAGEVLQPSLALRRRACWLGGRRRSGHPETSDSFRRKLSHFSQPRRQVGHPPFHSLRCLAPRSRSSDLRDRGRHRRGRGDRTIELGETAGCSGALYRRPMRMCRPGHAVTALARYLLRYGSEPAHCHSKLQGHAKIRRHVAPRWCRQTRGWMLTASHYSNLTNRIRLGLNQSTTRSYACRPRAFFTRFYLELS